MKKAPSGFRFKIKHAFYRLQGKKVFHLLHPGKTGGTAIKDALRHLPENAQHVIYLHPHDVKLKDIPRGEKVIFFLRDPATRFVSGFYSRQRQGQPRHFFPWSPGEKRAFELFSSPSRLANAIFSTEPALRENARFAMRTIQHVKNSYWEWFGNEAYLQSRLADLFFIGFQERLEEDFNRLKMLIGLPETLGLPVDDIRAHRTPQGFDKSLDPGALCNLKEWYKEDYHLLEICRNLIRERQQ